MRVKHEIDPDVPLNSQGVVYHIEANSNDIANRILLMGDPGRVPWAASFFDAGSIRFDHQHREIRTITGTYQGVPLTAISTGMGTDNMEIILNELHILKEYNAKTGHWEKPANLTLIRVGTCGSPQNIPIGALAITQNAIGLDNTCLYYGAKAETTPLGQVGIYRTRAHPDVISALVQFAQTHASNRPHIVGTTASASGFYACQGRAVGRLKSHMRFPNLIDLLEDLGVINIEMENSVLCFLANLLGYKAGTICSVVSTRHKEHRAFATPDQIKTSLHDALTVALNAIIVN